MKKSNRNLTPLLILITLILFTSADIYAKQDTTKTYSQAIQDAFYTELVYPQEKNEVQLTAMPELLKSGNYSHFLLPFIAEYGITDNWQLEFEWVTFQSLKPGIEPSVNGIGDLEIGTMYSFMNIGGSDFHFAGGFDIGIPTGNEEKGLGEGIWELEPYFLSAADFPAFHNLQIFSKIGLGLALNNKEEETAMNVGGGFFIPFNKIVFVSELNWYNEGEWNALYYTPGVIVNLPGRWESGIAVPVGINKNSGEFGLKAILTYEFNLSGDSD